MGTCSIVRPRQRNLDNQETANLIKPLPVRVAIVQCDLASDTQVKGLIKKVTGKKEEGGMGEVLDILVNCGGIQRRTPAENFPDEDWNEVCSYARISDRSIADPTF